MEIIIFVTLHFLIAIFPLPGFHVSEVAHDFVLQLKTWIVSKGMLNSFDSWHGKCLVFLSHEPLLLFFSPVIKKSEFVFLPYN